MLLSRSEDLADPAWPAANPDQIALGTADLTLPDGDPGRAVLIEFSSPREIDHSSPSELQPPSDSPYVLLTPADMPPRIRILLAIPRQPLTDVTAIALWSTLAIGAALLLTCSAAAAWAVRRGLRPLTNLSARVQSLGPHALGSRLGVADLPEELQPIALQVNNLLDRLQHAFDRERRFTAAASHELRTPIAELRTLLEVTSTRPRTPEQWEAAATTALDVLARAHQLCEALLELARAGSPRAGAPHLADITSAITTQATRALAAKTADPACLRVSTPASLSACIDPAALASILHNLLTNALSHGAVSPNRPATISAHAENQTVIIEVANHAPALASADLEHLFEPFWQQDAARARRQGFGLGLALCRELAIASGGRLSAELGPDAMLTLRVELPLAATGQ